MWSHGICTSLQCSITCSCQKGRYTVLEEGVLRFTHCKSRLCLTRMGSVGLQLATDTFSQNFEKAFCHLMSLMAKGVILMQCWLKPQLRSSGNCTEAVTYGNFILKCYMGLHVFSSCILILVLERGYFHFLI
jgi:hypothetical protein